METKGADTIIQAIIIITSIFTVVVAFVIAYILYFNKRKSSLIAEKKAMREEFQQQLRQSQIEVQEHAYQHIGKELHDNIGQLLSTSRMLLGLTERALPSPPDTLLTANETLAQAIQEIRALSKSLDKQWLEQFSFIDNLKTETGRINSGGNILAEFVYDERINLKSDEQIILFRIVQEAVQNAIKHAKPDHIAIHAMKKENNYLITITDDGSGFSTEPSTNGMGLLNMKHRTILLGGTISWDNATPQGTIVTISLPVKEETA